MKLASAAYLEGFYFKPRIDKQLLEAHSEGLICLSGCASSEFNRALLRGHGGEEELREAIEVAQWFHGVFGDRYFIEIMNNGAEIQRLSLEGAVEVAHKLGLPLVATCDTHYVDRDGFRSAGRVALHQHRQVPHRHEPPADGRRPVLPAQSAGNVRRRFPISRRPWRAARRSPTGSTCSWNWANATSPCSTCRRGRRPSRYLRELCEQGLRERYADDPEMCRDGQLSEVVRQRLDRELDVINKLGFPNYFLIVWDFVREAREPGSAGHGARQRRRSAGLLCALPEPRLPAQVRPAVRAIPGREPSGSAGYRHRFLQGTSRGHHPLRQGQVRRGERRADRHVRHAGGAGRDQGRRPRLGDSARPRQSDHGAWCRSSWTSRCTRRWN